MTDNLDNPKAQGPVVGMSPLSWHQKNLNPKLGQKELVLYLDFDGVLHHENVHFRKGKGAHLDAPARYVLFQHVDLLTEILVPFPEIKIVLSTTWVRLYGCNGAAKRLPHGIRGRVIGATYHSSMDPNEFYAAPRGMQVWSDVLRRQPKDWLALDDDYLHWPAWCRDKYIRTHAHEGISDPAVQAEFREKLALICSIPTPKPAEPKP